MWPTGPLHTQERADRCMGSVHRVTFRYIHKKPASSLSPGGVVWGGDFPVWTKHTLESIRCGTWQTKIWRDQQRASLTESGTQTFCGSHKNTGMYPWWGESKGLQHDWNRKLGQKARDERGSHFRSFRIFSGWPKAESNGNNIPKPRLDPSMSLLSHTGPQGHRFTSPAAMLATEPMGPALHMLVMDGLTRLKYAF